MNILGTQFTLEHNSLDIYIAGCSGKPHCSGCHNPESWDFNKGEEYSPLYFDKIKQKNSEFDDIIENIMIFGGEPLDQDKDELLSFLKDMKRLNKKIWLFTRYELNEIPIEIYKLCNFIKTGKYDKRLLTEENVMFGVKLSTKNQKIHKTSERYHTEIWKEIDGVDGKYSVSNTGKVKNNLTNKILKGERHRRGGYVRINMQVDRGSQKVFMHRLVANAFLEKPLKDKNQINHKDMNVENNHVENLEWVTCKENINHAFKNNSERTVQLKNMAKKRHIALHRKVAKIDIDTGDILKIYDYVAKTSEDGFEPTNIYKVCNGERNHHGGFKWAFLTCNGGKCEI